jgi:hypothetical protein
MSGQLIGADKANSILYNFMILAITIKTETYGRGKGPILALIWRQREEQRGPVTFQVTAPVNT